jgi:hypothetical protein
LSFSAFYYLRKGKREKRMRGTDYRRLLDAQLAEMVENPGSGAVDMSGHEEVVGAMMALLQKDGLSVG